MIVGGIFIMKDLLAVVPSSNKDNDDKDNCPIIDIYITTVCDTNNWNQQSEPWQPTINSSHRSDSIASNCQTASHRTWKFDYQIFRDGSAISTILVSFINLFIVYYFV